MQKIAMKSGVAKGAPLYLTLTGLCQGFRQSMVHASRLEYKWKM